MTSSNEQVTLQKGDYIATADLSEDDYNAAVEAIESAGFNDYGCVGVNRLSRYKNLLIDESGDLIGYDSGHQKIRQLTLSQILNATNAVGDATEPTTETTPMHLTDRLEAAIREQSKANAEVERLQAEWRAAYPGVSGCVDIDVEDIKPEDWKAGDIVECVDDRSTGNTMGYFTTGKRYEVVKNDGSICFKYSSNEAEPHYAYNKCFRFIRRP